MSQKGGGWELVLRLFSASPGGRPLLHADLPPARLTTVRLEWRSRAAVANLDLTGHWLATAGPEQSAGAISWP